MLTHKQKMINYLNFKGISQDKFSRTCDVSSGFLRQGKSFSSSLLPIMRKNYTDLNLNWLIFDEGKMILNEDDSSDLLKSNNLKEDVFELQKQLIKVQQDLIIAQKVIQAYQKTVEESV